MGVDFAAVAGLLANPARAAVIDALMAGRPLAAGELARLAGVRPSTVSGHLAALTDGGLLTVVNAGRHRYYKLASAEVAHALEALSRICPVTPVRSLRQAAGARNLRLARTCYDHVAGALGVALLDTMVSTKWLVPGYTSEGADFGITDLGEEEFDRLGVDIDNCRRARRHLARPCLDWTERRMHLAGALGAALTTALLDRDWIRRVSPGRGLRITTRGRTALQTTFTLDPTTLDAP